MGSNLWFALYVKKCEKEYLKRVEIRKIYVILKIAIEADEALENNGSYDRKRSMQLKIDVVKKMKKERDQNEKTSITKSPCIIRCNNVGCRYRFCKCIYK